VHLDYSTHLLPHLHLHHPQAEEMIALKEEIDVVWAAYMPRKKANKAPYYVSISIFRTSDR
jgi:hypothetical protein